MKHWRQISVYRLPCRYTIALVSLALLCSCFSKGALQPGDTAPAFELNELNGQSFRFKPGSGKIHVLYFWADWCPRCEDDFRLMDGLYEKWKRDPNSPRFLAVDVGQSAEHVRNFVKRLKTSFPIYMDEDGKVARSFGVKGLPTFFVSDKTGTIRHIILGWAEEKTLLEEIRKLDVDR